MSKIAISLTVNGEPRQVLAEPREQLADLLRGALMLTGTHLGCEHGVCGACTVEIDGAPARSCITHAGSCDGAAVRTIEGFGDDPVMAALREAFAARACPAVRLLHARHAGRRPRRRARLPAADEARVREEMAGNLCRCTGYRGIVRAVLGVLASRRGDAP